MYGGKAIIGNIEATQSLFSCYQGLSCPANILQLSARPEQNKLRLMLCKIDAVSEENAIFKRTFVKFETEYLDQYVELDTLTGDIEFHNLTSEFMNGQNFDRCSLEHALSFLMEAIKFKNMFVYSLFTEIVPNNQVQSWQNGVIIANIMKHIEDINLFEKVVKVSGAKFLFSNLTNPSFQLQNAKKLKKVMGIPEEVRAYIKTNKLEHHFAKFQKLSENPNDAKDFVEYLKAAKKLLRYDRYSLERFLDSITGLVENSDLSLRQILGHLIRENYFFGTLGLPTNEAAEWKDCLTMAAAANIPLDKCPQNIFKYHRILAKNVDILNNPRTEEFAEAVSLYSRLEKVMEDEGYIIRPPKSEQELVEEGNVLHHCVASYRDKIIDEKAIVLFCRKIDDPDTPLYTIELDYTPGDTSFSVTQFKKVYDADVLDADLLKMLNKYLLNRRYIIEGGKNLFRKPRTFKPKKGEDVSGATVEEEGET